MHQAMASISNKECSPMIGGHLQADLPCFYQQPETITEWTPFLNSYDKQPQSQIHAEYDLASQPGLGAASRHTNL